MALFLLLKCQLNSLKKMYLMFSKLEVVYPYMISSLATWIQIRREIRLWEVSLPKHNLFKFYLRALSTLRGLRGAPEVPPLCRETQSLGQQMLRQQKDSLPKYNFFKFYFLSARIVLWQLNA